MGLSEISVHVALNLLVNHHFPKKHRHFGGSPFPNGLNCPKFRGRNCGPSGLTRHNWNPHKPNVRRLGNSD